MLTTLKLTIRNLRRTPSFTVMAILILALGIGATTAMFTITRTILFKPLAYREPDRLVSVMLHIPAFAHIAAKVPVNASHYQFWKHHSRTLQDVALIGPHSALLSGNDGSLTVEGVRVTPNFFNLLGLQPRLGRGFLPQEAIEANSKVVILSDELWRSRFGADPHILGRKISLNGQSFQVIGVTAPQFPSPRGRQLAEIEPLPEQTQYWIPLVFSKYDLADAASNMNYLGVARLKLGASVAQTYSELDSFEKNVLAQVSEEIEMHPLIEPLQASLAGGVRNPLWALLGAVCLVLLIVCINLMNLMLVRAANRRREWAIRLAVGGSFRQLMQEALSESFLLSSIGGALGILVAVWFLALVRAKAPFDLPRIEELQFDPAALFFTFLIAAGSALLFGILPAWKSSRTDPQEALQSSSRSSTENRKGLKAGNVLVVAEVALTVVLTLSAGLLLRSFFQVLNVPSGVQAQQLVSAFIQLPPEKYQNAKTEVPFFRRLLEKTQSAPGIVMSGITTQIPLTAANNNNPMTAADRPVPPVTQWPMTDQNWVSSQYFQTAGIPLKAGRIFEDKDGEQRVAVISENLAVRLWPGENALGHTIQEYQMDGKLKPWRVIGVVGTVHAASLTKQPENMVYFPFWQNPDNAGMNLVLRTTGNPRNTAATIRKLVAGLDPQVSVSHVRLMEEVISDSVAQRRFQLSLLIAFAVSALVLACLGIYGVLAFSVSRRRSEIGIRMALGARPAQVRQTILQQGLTPVFIGLAVGFCLSVLVGTSLKNLLFNVNVLDPLTYASTAVTLLLVAALACWLPAQRAARLNPIEALRND